MDQDDSILRYYEAEMRYLRESGKEFARVATISGRHRLPKP
jgi:type VI protein secretion system component VasA